MSQHDIVVIGASAGGVQALSRVVGGLSPDLPASIFIVQHLAPYGTSAMPAILSRSGPLPAGHPREGEVFEQGRIYIAPPDQHILIDRRRVYLSHGPAENRHRPAIDVLFRSAARSHNNRVIGVVLTGNLDDGTAGLSEVKKYGGLALVQDPADADYPSMPQSAIDHVTVDEVAPLSALPDLLNEMVLLDPEPVAGDADAEEGAVMKEELEWGEDREHNETPSGLTCPECGGALWESHNTDLVHFRCRTGHAFSPETLLVSQSETFENTLWAAVRSLEENAALARRMERWMVHRGNEPGIHRYHQRAEDAEKHAAVLRQLLVK